MNIFAVNNNPVLAAFDLPDKLVVKMPTESLQLLTPYCFNQFDEYIQKPDGTTYGTKGFAHHPCAKWLYESPSNPWWLLTHANAMCGAYYNRYRKSHGVVPGLKQVGLLLEKHYPTFSCHDHTPFVTAMPDEFKIVGDPVQSYRDYLIGAKGYSEWRYSEKPSWWDDKKHEPVRNQYLAEREAKRMKRKHEHQRASATV